MGKSEGLSKTKPIRFSHEEIEETNNYMKKERISNFSQAIRILRKKGLITEAEIIEITKEKDQQIKELKEAVEMLRKGVLKDMNEISEKPCPFLVCIDDEKVCGDIDAPIPSYLKRNLTAQICMICRKKRVMQKREKPVKKSKEVTSNIYKTKAKKIYCYGLYREVTREFLNSHQVMCKNCELRSPTTWAKCMKERATIK